MNARERAQLAYWSRNADDWEPRKPRREVTMDMLIERANRKRNSLALTAQYWEGSPR